MSKWFVILTTEDAERVEARSLPVAIKDYLACTHGKQSKLLAVIHEDLVVMPPKRVTEPRYHCVIMGNAANRQS